MLAEMVIGAAISIPARPGRWSWCGEPVCSVLVTTSHAKMPDGWRICWLGSAGSAFDATDSRWVSRRRLLCRRGRTTQQSGGRADRRAENTLDRVFAVPAAVQRIRKVDPVLGQFKHATQVIQVESWNSPTKNSQRPPSLPEHSEATDRIPKRATHKNIRQEMNVERQP
jgi:hypothetical protein